MTEAKEATAIANILNIFIPRLADIDPEGHAHRASTLGLDANDVVASTVHPIEAAIRKKLKADVRACISVVLSICATVFVYGVYATYAVCMRLCVCVCVCSIL